MSFIRFSGYIMNPVPDTNKGRGRPPIQEVAHLPLTPFRLGFVENFAEILGVGEQEAPERRQLVPTLAPLAQLVEQLTLNQWVPGSNP